ncbi:alpha/beta fold hydrolase [Glutamicibacter sp. BW77]|uniref:alpha/beta fold hydrolase n=1 Tax=Glutamicibacter sp. BW77 TaxID=2024402 RepID=UPI001481F955|nr:alpha/beta fold hydrolase [Glutamicibacter sp. BW77]
MSLDLNLRVITASNESEARAVLLIHGFASSAQMNWNRSRWVQHFHDQGRDVILLDLPGHGEDPYRNDGSWTPTRIREAIAAGLEDLNLGPVDVLGYSLGARLGWEFAAHFPQLVNRLVMGGPASIDPLAAFEVDQARAYMERGEEIHDEYTAKVINIAKSESANDFNALFRLIEAIKTDPYIPASKVPACPTLLMAGDHDDLATTMPQLRRLLKNAGTESAIHWLPGRNHANAVTSREFKEKALEFFASA